MLLKFFLAIIIVGINPVCTLKATDFYPDNLPDLFWPLRDHFYDRLAGPTATKENFKSTLCEFVRVCDYISPDSIMRNNLRRDIDKYSLVRGVTPTAKIDILDALNELEETSMLRSGDFYSTRPIPGYIYTATPDDPLQEAVKLYPQDVSSFFWVARDRFYAFMAEESSPQEIRTAFCEFISVGDHVAAALFMSKSLRNDFNEFAFKKGIKRKRKAEILGILSELEALSVYTARPMPEYSPIKTQKEIAHDALIMNTIIDYVIKQRTIVAEAKSFMGTAFGGLLSPEDMATRLKVNIRGQDAAMNTLGIIGHKIMAQIRLKQADSSWVFRPPHAFLIGKSGSGKTQSVIELCKIIGIPWIRVNAPEIVGEGFKGPTLSYNYEQLKQAGKIPPYAIVILDEAGKMGTTGVGDNAPKYGGSIMRTLLAHMDGATVKVPAKADGTEETISTNCFTYLATDACAHVPNSVDLTAETLSSYTGMPLELVNRFSQGIIKLVPHTIPSLVDILKNNASGAYNHERSFFKKLYNIDLVIEDAGLRAIAARSIADSTGARKLEELLGHILAPVYSLPAGLITEIEGARKITLTEEFVRDHLPPPVKKINDEPPFGMYT